MSPVTTILELNPSRVRNIFICSGVVFWASSRMMKLSFKLTAAHECERRDLDHPALQVLGETRSGSSMSCSASNSGRRYGSTLAIRSPGRNPRRSPASTAGRVRMIRLTSRRVQRAGGQRHRQEGLAGAGWSDPECDRAVPDRVDVALLVDSLGGDLVRPVAPDNVLQDRGWDPRAGPAPARPPRSSPGAISWPWATSADSSLTTAVSGPRRRRAHHRGSACCPRNTSQSRWPCRARRIASPVPANSAAARLSSSICLRIRVRVRRARPARAAEARLPVDLAAGAVHHNLHHCAHVLRSRSHPSAQSRLRPTRGAPRRPARAAGSRI